MKALLDEHYLPRILSLNEFNVEATKKKLEAYLTLKTTNHGIFNVFNMDEIVMPTENLAYFVPMPKLDPNKQRIYVGGLKGSDISRFNQGHLEQFEIHNIEFGIQFDSATSFILVIDAKNTSLEMITKLDVLRVINMANLIINGYQPDVIEAIHLLNLNKGASVILGFLKKVVHHKIMDTVQIHSDLESLYKYVPKEYLPEEYGGTQGSMTKIIALMDEVLLENKQYLLDLPKFAADESRRLRENYHTTMFGTEGTFRALNID